MPVRSIDRAQSTPKAAPAGSRRRFALRQRPALESLEGRQLLSTFAVSSEADGGTGSLRQAIINSNSTAATPNSPNIISFSGLSNLVPIQLQSQLPTITQPVIIDGTTANSYNGNHPVVQLIGNYAGSGALGLDITASGTQVKALAIDGFNAGGVLINDASNVVLDHDYVGLNPNANATGQDVNGNVIYEGNGTYGVTINSDIYGSSTGDVVSNDVVSANSYNGIILSGASTTKNVVSGTIIGSDNTGAAVVDDPGNALGNGQHGGGGSGVVINQGASYNTIGGTTAAARDVILGNKSYGVYITDGNTAHNVVEGDAIGTDITGTHGNDGSGRSYGNGLSGVAIVFGATFNVVSGTATAPEVISDNAGDGVLISGSMTSSNQVSGVDIGTDQTGEVALPNAGDGVAVTFAASNNFVGLGGARANVISGNTGNGVSLTGFATDTNIVENNLIGIDAKGTTGLGNGQDGVLVNGQASNNLIGYAASGDNNVISGNGTFGVYISDTGTNSNTVANDIIGLTALGNAPVSNTDNGVDVFNGAQNNTIGGTTAAARNVISGNLHEGVLVGGSGTASNVVEGNFIGTDSTGKALLGISLQLDGVYVGLGAGSNTIGGQNPTGALNTAAWNVISGNENNGILVTDSGTTGTVICGNFIGTDVTGTTFLSNFGNGITIAAGTSNTTVGAETSGIGNLNIISGNAGDGLSITSSSGNNISFDYFGVDFNNKIALGNAGNGVSIHLASGNRVNLNVIENNGGYGILTDTGANNNAWYYDSIYGNTKGGIATPTDASPQPAPQLLVDSVAGGQTTITGVIFASPDHSASLIVQFYVSPASTAAASIQGQTFVGQSNVTTDANGNAVFTATLPKVYGPGQIFTATVDYNVTNTSVFSNALAVPVLAPPTLAAIPSQTVAPGQNFVLNLQGSDPAGLPLAYTARVDSLAYHLTSTLGLYESGGSFHTNLLGGGEQWVQGNGGGWYYILPSGALYAWSGSGLNGTLIAQLDPTYNANPSLLVNAKPGQGQATASTSGSSLTLTPNSGFTGVLFVTATASDGYNTASQTFQLTVAAPTLPTVPATATFVKSDTTTQGSWMGAYGAQGYDVLDGGSSLPSGDTVSIVGASTYTWATNSTDPRALQAPGGGGRIAAAWYSTSSFTVAVNLGDNQSHGLELYLLDWDNKGRSEKVQISDAKTGAVLATASASSFQGGTYLDFTVSGNVLITFTNQGGANAVLNGLFLNAAVASMPTAATATFLKADTMTQGSWMGAYGAQGYDIVSGPASFPAGDTITPSNQLTYTWTTSTSDVRGLQVPGSSNRVAAVWYSSSSFTVDVNLGDGHVHDLELYFADWDTTSRSEKVQLSDAVAGTVLDTESIASFHGGEYLDWKVSGHILITITHVGGSNAVLNGVFLDPVVTMSQMDTAGVGMVPAGGRQPSLIEASFADLLTPDAAINFGVSSASGSPASGQVATHSIDSLATTAPATNVDLAIESLAGDAGVASSTADTSTHDQAIGEHAEMRRGRWMHRRSSLAESHTRGQKRAPRLERMSTADRSVHSGKVKISRHLDSI